MWCVCVCIEGSPAEFASTSLLLNWWHKHCQRLPIRDSSDCSSSPEGFSACLFAVRGPPKGKLP